MFHKILRLDLYFFYHFTYYMYIEFFLYFYDHNVDPNFTIHNEGRPFSELYIPLGGFYGTLNGKKRAKTWLFT